ncbi:MAG: DUF4097 family beta strand repeat protein [Candidatus Cloacimonetes bacterium]|nr:DUF4097 family beta strand repeat protein [Candidatus Cloacimonadota bacterium]
MLNYDKTLQVKEGLKVNIETSLFAVKAFRGDDNTVSIKYNCDYKGDTLQAEDLFAIYYNEKDNVLKIEERSFKSDRSFSEALLLIGLPDLRELKLENENGSVEIKGLNSKIKIENENGAISVLECKGLLDIENENGLIKIKGFSGELDIENENGSINVIEGSGLLKGETENGHFKVLKSLFSQVEIESENGSIFYHLPMLDKGKFIMKNVNGKIHLIIPNKLSLNLKAKNENGRFHIGLQNNYETERDNGSKTIKMVRGVGKVDIILENVNGSIDLLDDKPGNFGFKFHHFGHKHGFEHMKHEMSDMFENMGDLMGDKIRLKIMKKMKDKGWKMEDIPDKFRHKFYSFFNDMKLEEDEDESTNESEETHSESAQENYRELEERILKMVEKGTITTEEAEKLLNTLKEE